MQLLRYNLIKGPKKTVNDYLQSLNDEDLQSIYSASHLYGIKLPDLMKKMQHELKKRKIGTQAVLF